LSPRNASLAYQQRTLAASQGDAQLQAAMAAESQHSRVTRLLTDVLVMQLVLQDVNWRGMMAIVAAGCEAQFQGFTATVVAALGVAVALALVFFEAWWVPQAVSRARKLLSVQLIRSILVAAIVEHDKVARTLLTDSAE